MRKKYCSEWKRATPDWETGIAVSGKEVLTHTKRQAKRQKDWGRREERGTESSGQDTPTPHPNPALSHISSERQTKKQKERDRGGGERKRHNHFPTHPPIQPHTHTPGQANKRDSKTGTGGEGRGTESRGQ